MDFNAIILENMGKDIYIGMEMPKEPKRQEFIIKDYRVTAAGGKKYAGEETAYLFSDREQKEVVEIGMKVRIERWNCLFDMIDIEARYQRYFYHIYIMNCINIQNSRLFLQQQKNKSV